MDLTMHFKADLGMTAANAPFVRSPDLSVTYAYLPDAFIRFHMSGAIWGPIL